MAVGSKWGLTGSDIEVRRQLPWQRLCPRLALMGEQNVLVCAGRLSSMAQLNMQGCASEYCSLGQADLFPLGLTCMLARVHVLLSAAQVMLVRACSKWSGVSRSQADVASHPQLVPLLVPAT